MDVDCYDSVYCGGDCEGCGIFELFNEGDEMIDAALKYLKAKYSVIPVGLGSEGKSPYIPWEEFQKRLPTESEIRAWWNKWPNANIALITGSISDVVVIDIDDTSQTKIQELIPESLVIPSSLTPSGGQHLFFKAPATPLPNNAKAVPGCDFRGSGGYVLIPPSKGYTWFLSILDAEPPCLPDSYIFFITNSLGGYKGGLENISETIPEGQRDETLFHAANRLFRGGADEAEVRSYLRMLAAQCDPPFPEKELEIKIKSALKRAVKRDNQGTKRGPEEGVGRILANDMIYHGISDLQSSGGDNRDKSDMGRQAGTDGDIRVAGVVREWVVESQGSFQMGDIIKEVGLGKEHYPALKKAIQRLIGASVIERVGSKHGVYRRVEKDILPMEFANLDDTPLGLVFPLRVHEWVKTMPKNLIVIAGEPNAGKTAFLMAFTELNMKNHSIRYLSSEMGPLELKTRLKEFTTPLGEWPPIFFERTGNFEDLVMPEGITIVDYLEVSDEFYKVGGMLTAIFNKLITGIALVAIQKNPGTDYGLGGARGLEKPRLYLSMKPGELKITKGKNWARETNPNGLCMSFKLVRGAKFIEDPEGWRRP